MPGNRKRGSRHRRQCAGVGINAEDWHVRVVTVSNEEELAPRICRDRPCAEAIACSVRRTADFGQSAGCSVDAVRRNGWCQAPIMGDVEEFSARSEEHTSELQSLR